MASSSRSSEDTSNTTCEDELRESDTGEDADVYDQSSVNTFLSRFKQPDPSYLTRKRKVQRNPPTGMKRSKGRTENDPKRVSEADRIKQFPNEHFTLSRGKLFCLACREELSTKKSILELHTKSAKHAKGKEVLNSKEKRELTIVEALQRHDKVERPVGDTLPASTRVFRVQVVSEFLKAGIPLYKIDKLRGLLESGGYSLSHSTHLRQLIPFILNEEMDNLREQLSGKCISIIFDGTTHVAEAFVVVVRYVDSEWVISQKVAQLLLLSKSLCGEEVARLLVDVLSTKVGVPTKNIVAAMRDRASVNSVAMQTVRVLYNRVFDVGCLSHTLDHVGEKMNTPLVDEFVKQWIGMFSRSPKTRLAWKTLTRLPSPSYSATRWWSWFEVLDQAFKAFGDVCTFLNDPALPPATSSKIRAILSDVHKYRKLKIELAMLVDAMTPFVKATYNLEGDGPLVLTAYREISTLHSVVANQHYPNVMAIAKKESAGNSSNEQLLIRYAKNCVTPAYEYFTEKFDFNNGEFKVILSAFKAARYFSPSQMDEIRPTPADMDSLKAFSFIEDDLITRLKEELPRYKAAAEDVSREIDTTKWWKDHQNELPAWAEACKLVLLVQPSSAAAERVFSLLENSFSQRQNSALEDCISLSVMLQYNHK